MCILRGIVERDYLVRRFAKEGTHNIFLARYVNCSLLSWILDMPTGSTDDRPAKKRIDGAINLRLVW